MSKTEKDARASRRPCSDELTGATVAVVVITHNRAAVVRECVENVLLHTSPSTTEIVLWNNASTDGTQAYLDSLTDPRVRVVHHPENIALNAYAEAFALTSADY